MISIETNKERVIRELKEAGYNIGMSAEQAVVHYAHKPDSTVSFDETETLSFFNNGEVVIALTGLDLLSRYTVEETLQLIAEEISNDVHTCLKKTLKESFK